MILQHPKSRYVYSVLVTVRFTKVEIDNYHVSHEEVWGSLVMTSETNHNGMMLGLCQKTRNKSLQ